MYRFLFSVWFWPCGKPCSLVGYFPQISLTNILSYDDDQFMAHHQTRCWTGFDENSWDVHVDVDAEFKTDIQCSTQTRVIGLAPYSNSQILLAFLRDCSSSHAGPTLWSSLPLALCTASSAIFSNNYSKSICSHFKSNLVFIFMLHTLILLSITAWWNCFYFCTDMWCSDILVNSFFPLFV